LITDAVPVRPGRSKLSGTGAVRWFRRESTLVVFAGLAIAAIFNWRVVIHPRSTIVTAPGDPLLQAWTLAWNSHFLGGDGYWTSNIFYPSKDNVAFTDALLGYLPLSWFGSGPNDALFRYNIAFVLAYAIAFIGGYWLVRQLGGNWQAAALGAVVYAWAPWRLAHNPHLNILSTGGIALALFALARGYGFSLRGGMRPELAKPGWALAGWLIATWQVSMGFGMGLPFVYVMGVVGVLTVVVGLVKRRLLGLRFTVFNGAGLVVFFVVTFLLTIPYLRVVDEYRFARTLLDLQTYSPPVEGLLTASGQGWFWPGGNFNSEGAGEQLIFPGLTVMLVAFVGVMVSVWSKRARVVLGISVLVVTAFALGTSFFGGGFTYLLLWENLPGWSALRTPGRLILWTCLLLILLAAGAVTRFGQSLAASSIRARKRLISFLLLLPALGALVEGIPAQSYSTVDAIPAGLRQVFAETAEPMIILPIRTRQEEFNYMLWSTEGFPRIANGMSSNVTPAFEEMVDAAKTFPDFYSARIIKGHGIRKVVVMKKTIEDSPSSDALTTSLVGLPIKLTQDLPDVAVFTLE
jgi:hypothetical protein